MGPFRPSPRPHCLQAFSGLSGLRFFGASLRPAPHTARIFRALWVGPLRRAVGTPRKHKKHKNTKTQTQTQTQKTKQPEENIFLKKKKKTKHFFYRNRGPPGIKGRTDRTAHFSLFCGFTRMATQALRVVISSDSEGDDPTYRKLFPFFGPASRARF
jgi:hypothetical protein